MNSALRDMNFDELCRLCMSETDSLCSVFSTKENDEGSLQQKIFDSTSLQIDRADGLPSNICLDCAHQVHAFYAFKRKCLSSDSKLREFLFTNHLCADKVGKEADPADSSSEYEFISENETRMGDESAVPDTYGPRPASPEATTPIDDDEDNCTDNDVRDVEITEGVGLIDLFSSQNPQSESPKLKPTKRRVPILKDTVESFENSDSEKDSVKNSQSRFLDGKFACNICSKVFYNNFSLKRHKYVHDRKRLICKLCRKAFVSPESLARHERMHENGKPYKCEHCQKSYSSSSAFAGHVRKHTGERPFKCQKSECTASFYLLSSLERHTAKHSGIKHFVCKICDSSFFVGDDLRAHVNRSH